MKLSYYALSLLFAFGSLSELQARPPTVDPTYGMERTAVRTVPGKAEMVAKWIWVSHLSDKQTVFARKSFSIKKIPRSAHLYVTADNLFTAWVNGHKLGSTPQSADDLAWTRPQRYPIARFLRKGGNVIAIQGVNEGGAAGILALVKLNGSDFLISDGSWRVLNQSTPPPSWNTLEFSDSSWRNATVIASYGAGVWGSAINGWPDAASDVDFLAHMPIAPVRVSVLMGGDRVRGAQTLANPKGGRALISPDKTSEGAPEVILLDFGKELAGRVQILGTSGAQVIVTTGESLQECDHEEPALDNHGPFSLILEGNESASTPYTAFRYARLQYNGSAPLTITKAFCDFKYYPVQYKGSFKSSDPLLTRIWYTGAYTAHLCMQEYIWDAPKRDRGLWIGDMQVTGQTINSAFGDRFLLERSINDVRDQAQGGRPNTELPVSDVNSIPGYSAAWFCTLADFYLHQGDKAFLARQHVKIISLLKYMRTNFDQKNLFDNPRKEWDFCDWAPGFITDSPLARATTDLYTIWGVRKAIFLLNQLGDGKNASLYSKWESELVQAARANLYDPQKGSFSDRLQENVMAVLSNVAIQQQAVNIYRQVIKPGSPAWAVPHGSSLSDSEVMSPYYGYFVLRAMGKLHEDQDALNLLRSYWGNMLSRGGTTWWEMFDPSWPRDFTWVINRLNYISLCHGWSSGPTSFLSERILGVRPTAPGYAKMVIQPNLCDLKWVTGTVPTPHGVVFVKASRENGRLTMSVRIPAGVQAQLVVPGVLRVVSRKGEYTVKSR